MKDRGNYIEMTWDELDELEVEIYRLIDDQFEREGFATSDGFGIRNQVLHLLAGKTTARFLNEAEAWEIHASVINFFTDFYGQGYNYIPCDCPKGRKGG